MHNIEPPADKSGDLGSATTGLHSRLVDIGLLIPLGQNQATLGP